MYKRNSLEKLYRNDTHQRMLKAGHIGLETEPKFYFFIANLVDLIFDNDSKFENIDFNGFTILKDLGSFEDGFGNASGGRWDGKYKKLLVKDRTGKHLTIGLGVLGSLSGYTYFIVSIEKDGKGHNSLQLNIDKNVKIINGLFYITHNGKLSNSNKGSVKYEVVKNYVKSKAPHLVSGDNLIQLGILPGDQLFLCSDKEPLNLITNLIEYAILRDEIRDNV